MLWWGQWSITACLLGNNADTVDGRNAAPLGMYKNTMKMGMGYSWY